MNTKVNEGKLISGKEALIALANGEEVEYKSINGWSNAKHLHAYEFLGMYPKLRLKPRTITINGIEVPAPFEPKVGEKYWFIADYTSHGYSDTQEGTGINSSIGKWRSEDEVKQVVAALRQVFGLSGDAVNAVKGGK